MSEKQEPYFVVSESALANLNYLSWKAGNLSDSVDAQVQQAEALAACRARPCVFDEDTFTWVEVRK